MNARTPFFNPQLSLFLFFCLISLAYNSQAQNNNKYLELDYSEIDSLMMEHFQTGAYAECLIFAQAGKEKAQAAFGENDTLFANYIAWTAYLYEQLGQYDKSLVLYKKTVDVVAKVRGKSSLDYVTCVNNLANLHQEMGHFYEAIPLLQEANQITEKLQGKEHPLFATSLNNLGLTYHKLNDFDRAFQYYSETKNIREKLLGKEHPEFASSLNNLGYLYKDMDDLQKALPLFIQAKDIFAKALGEGHPHVGMCLNNLGLVYSDLGDNKEALMHFNQAAVIIKNALDEEHPKAISTLSNLASLYREKGEFDKALTLYHQVVALEKKVIGPTHPNFAITSNNLALLYQDMGNYEEALKLFIQTKEIIENIVGTKHPKYILALNNIGGLYREMGNYQEAWTVFSTVLETCAALKLDPNLDSLFSNGLELPKAISTAYLEIMIYTLGQVHRLIGMDPSITEMKEKQRLAADLILQLLNRSRHQLSNEKDQLRLLSESRAWTERYLNALATTESAEHAFQLADQNKSVLLLQATRAETAYRLGELPDVMIYKNKKLQEKQSQLEANLLEKRSEEEKDKLRAELIDVYEEMSAFVNRIADEYPKYYQLKYQEVNTKAADIQVLLDDKTALLEYLISDSLLHIFLVTKTQVKWIQQAVNSKDLKDNIKRLHQVLSDYSLLIKEEKESYRNYTDLAHWFYQKTIAPVLEGNKGIENIIIVSDGELGHLPFETFLVEQAPQSLTAYHELHYLVNDYTISYNYSATLFVDAVRSHKGKENRQASALKNNGQLLAMAANYAIKLDSGMMDLRLVVDQSLRGALKPLPAARKEVETLQEKYQGFFAFDEMASEKVVKEKAADYAILHFATHGILDSKRPVLSSLAFTEDSDSLESNFWQAHEISKLELHADLVVLSACETGYGRFEQGNGIASLARAFMYAGASSLIVSLWQVNDFATAEIMKHLYANLAKGMKKDAALRQAKLQYMQSAKGITAHPAFWSPFIQMGNTNPVQIKTKGNALFWMMGVGLLALLGMGGLALKMKRSA